MLSHPAVTLVKRLGEQRNVDVIREALKDALGVDWKIRCEAGGAAAPPAPQQPPSDDAGQAQREDEERMLAEAGSGNAKPPRRDPEEAALELLQNELGARRIDGG